MKLLFGLFLTLLGASACSKSVPQMTIVDKNTVTYSIVIPVEATALEKRSAKVLQDYIQRISGKTLSIANEGSNTSAHAIYIGNTKKGEQIIPDALPAEGYQLQVSGADLAIRGGSGRGLVYGVYTLLEKYMGCRKIADAPTIVVKSEEIKVPAALKESGKPQFLYRESFYPASHDAEYLEWNKMQQFEELWGLWGHSYDKLVPAATYFKTHPEYYAQVRGVRQPTQLCLSNEDVFVIATNELKKRIAGNPEALYWSVSPNDDIGYCECDACKATDNAAGSGAGSLIKFVNRIAAMFPDKYITTLAYGYTHSAPKNLKPANNVYVFLSNIDAYRDKPLTLEPSAATFRNDVKAWSALTGNLFVWDYVTQFTNYLAPFPNLLTLQPNMEYYKQNGIKGVFEQGSGYTHGEWAELRSYVLVKLLENDQTDVKRLVESFLQDYYGQAAKFLLQYIGQLHGNMDLAKRKLDIYGNPVNDWNSYLTPEQLDNYIQIFDAAEGAVAGTVYAERVKKARLPLEYTILQQARFYGIEKFGAFVKNEKGNWIPRPKLANRIAQFVTNCKKAKVTELSEGGLSPDAYQAEWNEILAAGVTPTMDTAAKVTIQYPYAPEYPAKGNRTLVDGNPGYNDFSYNWLCFYGHDMVATIDLKVARNITSIKTHFLDDPRHWIFLPSKISIETSTDGTHYLPYANFVNPAEDEHYDIKITPFATVANIKARFVRVTANNLQELPAWRYRENKKPMIACDEVFIQ